MATQQQVDALQADLLAAETAMKNAMQNILDAANADPGCTPKHLKLLKISAGAVKDATGMFHAAAELCSIDGGVQPLSGGQPK